MRVQALITIAAMAFMVAIILSYLPVGIVWVYVCGFITMCCFGAAMYLQQDVQQRKCEPRQRVEREPVEESFRTIQNDQIMELFAVLINISMTCVDGRHTAEWMENEVFHIKSAPCLTTLAKYVREQIIERYEITAPEYVEVIPMTDFMEDFNDQNLSHHNLWFTYVRGEVER